MDVKVGRYRYYTKPGDHRIFIDRFEDKEWLIIDKGHKAILELMAEIDALRDAGIRSALASMPPEV